MFWVSVAHESRLLQRILLRIFHTEPFYSPFFFTHSDSCVQMITVALWWQESHLTWLNLQAHICLWFVVLLQLQVPLWRKHGRGKVLISSPSHTVAESWIQWDCNEQRGWSHLYEEIQPIFWGTLQWKMRHHCCKASSALVVLYPFKL